MPLSYGSLIGYPSLTTMKSSPAAVFTLIFPAPILSQIYIPSNLESITDIKPQASRVIEGSLMSRRVLSVYIMICEIS
jgi:hypothetical protein